MQFDKPILCLVIVIILAATAGGLFFVSQKETYRLMRNIHRFPLSLNPVHRTTGRRFDDSGSLKFRDHRYDRHHVRSNPHVRRYQD